jgi:hypothetical protein
MIRPMECPRCHEKPLTPFRYLVMLASGGKAFRWTVFAMNQNGCDICGEEIFAITRIGAILLWNAHCRRELRRMKKEGKEK